MQLSYIINMVLYPLIMYRLQCTPLSHEECNKITTPLGRLIKHKSSFSISAPNSLFHSKPFYNFNDLWITQLQALSTAILYQFNNNNLLQEISTIRLFQLQTLERLHVSLLIQWNRPFNKSSHSNLIGATFSLLNISDLQLSFNTINYLRNEIKGGSIPINNVLTHNIIQKASTPTIKYDLLFLDQFLTTDGLSLLTWKEIKLRSRPDIPKGGSQPTFFALLEQIVLENPNNPNDRLVKLDYRLENNARYYKPPPSVDINDNQKKEFLTIWNLHTNQPIIGQSVKKLPHKNAIIVQHFLPTDTSDQLNLIQNNSSIHKCNGCNINNDLLLQHIKNQPALPRNERLGISDPQIDRLSSFQTYNIQHAIRVEKAHYNHFRIPNPHPAGFFLSNTTQSFLHQAFDLQHSKTHRTILNIPDDTQLAPNVPP